ncbi:MAG: diaminopimelate decarboxylase [Deltaproteobacteria bacterium]|nr:diaminopimelate decarboxylase [Deltaproteobacteria bacterium]
MHHFQYHGKELYCEEVPLKKLAEEAGTPCYVYSNATLTRHFDVFEEAFADLPHLICFAVKANSNLAILRLFAKRGGGADIVSGGELFRARTAGIPANKIVYSGIGKTASEMKQALQSGILLFNVESEEELITLNRVAKELGRKAPIAIRVNPEIDPKTHPYIATGLKKSKFGVSLPTSLLLYQKSRSLPFLEIKGVSTHIGSQITQVGPFVEALKKVSKLVKNLRHQGFKIDTLDLGGGLGIPYANEKPPLPEEYGKAMKKELGGLGGTILLEPGRVIVGNSGVLLTKVLYRKKQGPKDFVIVDAGMNDLIRPSLYGSHHEIWPVSRKGGAKKKMDVVGPVCESGDFLAQERPLPAVTPGEYLSVMSAGAYGFVMSSNYNSRPRAAEVLVHGNDFFIIRQREEYKDLLRGEHVPRFLR